MGGKAKPGSGGARKGAGRPLLYQEVTEPIRLPMSVVGPLKALLAAKGVRAVVEMLKKEIEK